MTPIFIITFNQSEWLKRSIASYRALASEIDLIVHDNGSDKPEMMDLLANLEKEGVVVNRGPKITKAEELDNVNISIAKYFDGEFPPIPYVVTDPDIELSDCDPALLSVFGELLSRFHWAHCVGPMLRIDDIPTSYPGRITAINKHIDQFWRHKPTWIKTEWGRVAYIRAPVDTTFALHRAGHMFRRLRRGVRVYNPFEARHLDWYIEKGGVLQTATNISHWANPDMINRVKSAKFEGGSRDFFRVSGAPGALVAQQFRATSEGCDFVATI
ncbi:MULTISPECIES: hypothetical protein [Methylobacteriaceae]|uniref:glycosyltransferase family 2 protein n=1 Tax=Methylobacteriaceae TaxID=119045 RepID=UPI002F357304